MWRAMWDCRTGEDEPNTTVNCGNIAFTSGVFLNSSLKQFFCMTDKSAFGYTSLQLFKTKSELVEKGNHSTKQLLSQFKHASTFCLEILEI